jgi:hypothetical protein
VLEPETNPKGFPNEEGLEIIRFPAGKSKGERHTESVRTARIRLVPFDDIRLGKVARYLVKGLIPLGGLTVIWGPPKCGKSFWIFDLMMHVALGWNYRGHRIRQGSVVYCAFEGQIGFEARVEAFRQRHDVREAPFFLEPVTIDLVGEYKELIAVISRQLSDNPPAAVVLDTLNRSMRGSESSDEDMTAYVKAADAIREAFDCAVVVVHHCGVDGTRPRGHTSLTGAADAQISVKRDTNKNIVVTVECAKDGPEGEQILSALETVELGTDEDSEPITSCIVLASADKPKMTDRLTTKQTIGLRALDDALNVLGEQKQGHGWPSCKVVLLEHWRASCDRHSLSGSDKPDSKKKAFQRVRSDLLALGEICIFDDCIWRCVATTEQTGQTGQNGTKPWQVPDR